MQQEKKGTLETFTIRRMRLKDLAAEYQVGKDTIRTWMELIEEKVGERKGHYYTPTQVEIIVHHLGFPTKTLKRIPIEERSSEL